LEGFRSPLFILVGVQTVIVAALFLKTSDLERRLEAAATAPVAEASVIAPTAFADSAALSGNDVRAIIRDELAPLRTALSDIENSRGAPAPQAASPQRSAQTDRLYTDVQQEMRRLIAKGAASETEMAALESRIAELPAEQRAQAFSQISRAVSNGSLKARF